MHLFPAIEPFETGMFKADSRHTLYWEQSGNPAGVPVLFLHGGPGAGTLPTYRRFFDPAFYRIVLCDQRGAGRSTPAAEIAGNTTWDLVADLEKLRETLGIERWLLFGGSWGSTLALAYGESYPDRCLGFILRGVFLFRRFEVDWFLYGLRTVFPDAWRRFARFVPEEERDDLLTAYRRRLDDPDPAIHRPAAAVWCAYEEQCSYLLPRPADRRSGSLAMARIEAHYMAHGGFLDEGQLLARLPTIHHLPAIIVQGRYDAVCPAVTADDLAQAWPGAELVMVPDAGHSAMEPGTRAALVEATQRFRDRLEG